MTPNTPTPLSRFRQRLAVLYFGQTSSAVRFQLTLAVIDLAIIAFFLFGPYLRNRPSYLVIDYLIAVWIAAELAAQLLAAPRLKRWLLRPMTWIDVLILLTLLFPTTFFSFAFLRATRLWAIAQRPIFRVMLKRLGQSHLADIIAALINFVVFLFTVTGFVYTFFFFGENGLAGFVDAAYFTVATVTTTGFGDITLPGTAGKLTSIVTMIIGISLFVRLAQAIFRPYKVSFACPECGLQRHDADAVHCKACGHILNIPDEGD
ncbi:potassium channel family protein [Rhizobium halophytocola]|uniref:Voltage-gated potassium channel n=1 Tax=Rhizobium halophytocola TaxID=735519 RepID=A0ABS4E5Z9_9HYPH|nr:potassium channel family protein [Rhizobium halophytocola]MBP1853375.1 voltage-gated potassium channel [Rhizobium halophytocola]